MAGKLTKVCFLFFIVAAWAGESMVARAGGDSCNPSTNAAWCDAACWIVRPFGSDFEHSFRIGCLDSSKDCWCCKKSLKKVTGYGGYGGYGGYSPQYTYTCPDSPSCETDCKKPFDETFCEG